MSDIIAEGFGYTGPRTTPEQVLSVKVDLEAPGEPVKHSAHPTWQKANRMLRACLAETELTAQEQADVITLIKSSCGVSSLTHIEPERLMDCAFALFSRTPRQRTEAMRRKLAACRLVEQDELRELADAVNAITGATFTPSTPGKALPITRAMADRAAADAKAARSPATYSRYRSRRAS